MRQVFSTQRAETAEAVAQLLREAGIDVAVRNGVSYRGGRRVRFSYSEPIPANQQPSVWVRHAGDQARAREILRERGLIDSTRPEQRESYVFNSRVEATATPKRSWAWRIRLVLFALIAAAALSFWLNKPTPAPVELPPTPGLGEDEIRIPIPPTADP